MVGVVGCLAYLYLLGKPYFAATQAEPRKVAEVSGAWAGACRVEPPGQSGGQEGWTSGGCQVACVECFPKHPRCLGTAVDLKPLYPPTHPPAHPPTHMPTQPLSPSQLLSFIPTVDVAALMDSAAGRTGTAALARTSSRSSDTEATD